jgi:hypothetical protein
MQREWAQEIYNFHCSTGQWRGPELQRQYRVVTIGCRRLGEGTNGLRYPEKDELLEAGALEFQLTFIASARGSFDQI